MARRRPIGQTFEAAVPIDRLVPHPENPRRGALDELQRSMSAHGFFGAVLAQSGTGTIIAGAHRVRAAKRRGRKTVPVLWLAVDDDQARRIMLVDNRTSDLAGYDDDALSDVLASLSESDLGLLGTGFGGPPAPAGRGDVDEFLDGADRSSDDYFTPGWVFELLDLTFDLDVASPARPLPWLPAKRRFTINDDGLAPGRKWRGRVWMNPPYSAPGPWVEKFVEHGHGVALLPISNGRWMRDLWAHPDVAWAVHTDRSIDFVGGGHPNSDVLRRDGRRMRRGDRPGRPGPHGS